MNSRPLTGNRWIVVGESKDSSGNGETFAIAYDLPGVSAASHGWLCANGSALRQNAPQ